MNLAPIKSPVCGLRAASIIAGLVSVAHLLRLLIGFQVVVGRFSLPVWLSAIGCVVMGLVSFWLWKLSESEKPTPPTTPAAA